MARIYRLIYKDIVADVGIDAAYLLAELIALQRFAVNNNDVSPDGLFVVPVRTIEENTQYKRQKQFYLLKVLAAAGYIQIEDKKGTGRRVRILSEQPQNGPVECIKNDTLKATNQKGERIKNDTLNVSNLDIKCIKNDTFPNNNKINIKNSLLNSLLSSSEQQQFFDLIVVYFREHITDEKKAENEAAAFYKYNRETFGADHLTIKNYKRHAAAWIKAGKHPPKKTGASKRGTKTAAEVAESQGVTVAELMNLEPLPVTVKADDIGAGPDLFAELLGGDQ